MKTQSNQCQRGKKKVSWQTHSKKSQIAGHLKIPTNKSLTDISYQCRYLAI